MNVISVLLTRDPRELAYLSCRVRTLLQDAIYEPGNGPLPDLESIDYLISDFLASRNVRNTFLLFISFQVCGILV